MAVGPGRPLERRPPVPTAVAVPVRVSAAAVARPRSADAMPSPPPAPGSAVLEAAASVPSSDATLRPGPSGAAPAPGRAGDGAARGQFRRATRRPTGSGVVGRDPDRLRCSRRRKDDGRVISSHPFPMPVPSLGSGAIRGPVSCSLTWSTGATPRAPRRRSSSACSRITAWGRTGTACASAPTRTPHRAR